MKTKENNNKLIATFMGYTHQSNSTFKAENGFWNAFKVFETWNWLMPVVQECYDTAPSEIVSTLDDGNDIGDITHALIHALPDNPL